MYAHLVVFCAAFFPGLVMCRYECDISADGVSCTLGHYLDGKDCILCPEGTFMDLEKHACRDCKKCREPKKKQILLASCTRDKDTEIECGSGTYWNGQKGGYAENCKFCSECPIGSDVVRNCSSRNDTVCAPKSYPLDQGSEAGNKTNATEPQGNNNIDRNMTKISDNSTVSTERKHSGHTIEKVDDNENLFIIVFVFLLVVIVFIIISITICIKKRRKAQYSPITLATQLRK